MNTTAFYWDERCFWHMGYGYTFTAMTGGLVQPLASGGTPEDPETKRRFRNLLSVTGLINDLEECTAPPATREDLLRVHPASYLDAFRALSDMQGGELTHGARASFGQGSYEIAALSAGLAKAALLGTLSGSYRNAYALCRPPGHHCEPERPNGFCLLNNIAIAIEAAKAAEPDLKVAVVDWDVHHGNGTEMIYLERPDVLTISVHQENNYPWDTGGAEVRGAQNSNMNIPLPPGGGHQTYLSAFERLVIPRLEQFKPDIVIVACGFDASGVDPLSRMIAGSNTFREMTRMLMAFCDAECSGRLMMTHEGGYSEVHVPFCGHAVLEVMSGSDTHAEDPLGPRMDAQQPNAQLAAYFDQLIETYRADFGI